MAGSRGSARIGSSGRLVRRLAAPIAVVTVVGVLSVPARGGSISNHARPARGSAGTTPASGTAPAAARGHVPPPLTRNSRTVRHANGSYTTTVYPGSVNYRNAAGWQPIDSTLVAARQAGFAWQNKANQYTASFARNAGGGYLRVQVGGQTFDFDAKGAGGSAGVASGTHLAYASAYPNADLSYDVAAEAVNETIVLRNASAPSSYEFAIHPRAGGAPVSAQRLADGSLGVYQAPVAGPVFVLQAPRATEDTGRVGFPGAPPHASMTVQPNGSGLDVRVSIDRAWLSSPARHFPVLLDPTITVQPDTQDAEFPMGCNCAGNAGQSLAIGTDPGGAWRSTVQFDLSSIPPGTAVTSAQLGLYNDGICLYTCGNSHAIEAHRMTAPWSRSNLGSQLQFDSTPLSTVTVTAGQVTGWLYWPITTTVQNWLTGAQPNDGLLMKRATEPLGVGGIFPPSSIYAAESTLQPMLQVTYTSDAVDLQRPSTLHSNGAELQWSQYTGPSGAPFEQYAVYRSMTANFTPSPSTLLTTISDPTVTTYRDTTAAAGQAFTYVVVANSTASNKVTVTLPADGQATKLLQPGPSDGQDTSIYYTAGSTNCGNYGADPGFGVGSGSLGISRGLLRFALNDIPASATVTSATLSLWQQYGASNALTLEAHRVTRSWIEGAGSNMNVLCGSGSTWYDAAPGVTWTGEGGDYDSTVVASLAKPAGQSNSWDNLSIASLVQQWVGGSAPNLGVLLKMSSEPLSNGNGVTYDSSDFTAGPSLRPKLALTYTDGSHALPPAVSVSAPAPGTTVAGSNVTLTAAASDDGKVDHVDFLVDGTVVGTASGAPYSRGWNSTTASNGTHTITANAVDNAGNPPTTSSPVTVTVDNVAPPTISISTPSSGATVSGTAVTVTAGAAATSPHTVSKVDFYWDNQLFATDTSSPYTASWNTLDPVTTAYDGTHALTTTVTDSAGQATTSAPTNVTVANTTGTTYRAGIALASGSTLPESVNYDPAGPQQQFGVQVRITNNSTSTLTAAGDTVAYRWYSPDTPSVVTTGSATSLGSDLQPGASATVTMLVTPPTLAAGVNSAQYQLIFDLHDSASSSWFAERGNPPLTAQVQVLRKSPVGLGLEKYYQYDAQPVGAGLDTLTNVASGNLVLNMTPWNLPGRGLGSLLELSYNGLEEHTRSPVGNNWSLGISSLTRFGVPLDVHPNNADTIAGVSNKLIGVTDGDGTLHVYTGTTNGDGTTSWTPPPGFDLYLRSTTTDTTSPRYWAVSRPDHVTFYYNNAGWPTSVVDKNGNTITFTETATPPGEDPGGAPFRITQVSDPGGRAVTISYYTKAQTANAHQRGRIADITDHLGHVLHFDYYHDGNLLRITQRGGTTANGAFLADRSWVFTYMTSNGSGPAIPAAADRVDPDPKTPDEDAQIYSVRDPNGHESTYAYYLNSDGPALAGRVKSLTDRAGRTTGYSYNTATSVTTVTDPLSHATTYAYDATGRVTTITDPLGHPTQQAWTADNHLSKITEANSAFSTYTYNANGYLTDYIDQDGNHTALTYLNRALDGTDTGTHWSLLATKTAPNGVAAGSGYRWQFGYDPAGNLLTATDPLGHDTSYCYNLAAAPACNPANDAGSPGTVEAVTDFNTHTTRYTNYDPNGKPQKVTDPLGRVTEFGFDADGNLLWTQDPLHATLTDPDTRSYRTYTDYDSFNRPGRQSQPKSTSLDRGQLIWTDTSYDANDNVTATQDAHYGQQDDSNGPTTTYSYDAMDRATLSTGPDTQADPAGQRTKMVYDAAGRLTSKTLPIGVKSGITNDHTTTYGYNAASQLTSQTEYTVNGSGTTTDTRTTYNCFDNVANLVTVTAPNARLASPPTCPATTVANTTKYTYDAAHQRKSITDPLGHQQSVIYDADGKITQSTDANGSITVNTYDQKDQLIKVVAPFMHGGRSTTTEYVYDPNGNKTRDISPRAYDVSTDKTTFTNYVTGYTYDAGNQLVTQTTPSDASTPPAYIHHYYDLDGRQIAISLPVAQTVPDPTQVSGAAKNTNELFDTGWIASSKDPATPTVHFDYTAQGWQTKRTPDKPSGGEDISLQQVWSYYPDGKTATYKDQGGQPSAYHYDADNNLTYAKTTHGQTGPEQSPVEIYADYTGYDQLAATHYRPTSATTYTGTTYSHYDHDGDVTERDDNAQQTLTSQTLNGDGVPISWTFTQTAGGAPTVNIMSYDAADWLSTQDNNGTSGSCTGRQRITTLWRPTGWESSRTIAGADSACTYTTKQTTTWTYFDNGKLNTDKITNSAGTVLETHTVNYSPGGVYNNGNRTTDAFALNGPGSTACTGTTPSCTVTNTYDARDRLKSATDGHGGTTSYTFDENNESNTANTTIRAGNITTQTTPQGTTTSTYKGNQLTSTTAGGATRKYWYDSLGRLSCVTTTAGNANSCDGVTTGNTVSSAVITANSYDFMDRFTNTSSYSASTLTGKASYGYDALDRTAQEIESHPTANLNRTTTFSYEGLTNLVTKEIQDNTGATINTDTKTYNYDTYGHRISLNDSTVSGGITTTGSFTYGYDVHGSASLLINQANGAVRASYGYTPYGASDTTLSKNDTAVNTPFNPYRYTAKRYDTGSQTLDMGARRFDPTTQRFLQLDQYQGALADLTLSADPLTQNRYNLAGGNPLSAVEYDGHKLALPYDGGGGGATSATCTGSENSGECNSGSGTQIGGSGPGTNENDYTTRHDRVARDAADRAEDQARLLGYTNPVATVNLPILGSSKNCREMDFEKCYTGRADIVLTVRDSGGNSRMFVWEVKKWTIGDVEARNQASHYTYFLRRLGNNASIGWDIGGPYTSVRDPGTQYWGGNSGAVVYGRDDDKNMKARLKSEEDYGEVQAFDPGSDRYADWLQPPAKAQTPSQVDGPGAQFCPGCGPGVPFLPGLKIPEFVLW
jgi:RHS repeat-associated protein